MAKKRVPTDLDLAMISGISAKECACMMMVLHPLAAARRAAESFVAIPPVPKPLPVAAVSAVHTSKSSML